VDREALIHSRFLQARLPWIAHARETPILTSPPIAASRSALRGGRGLGRGPCPAPEANLCERADPIGARVPFKAGEVPHPASSGPPFGFVGSRDYPREPNGRPCVPRTRLVRSREGPRWPSSRPREPTSLPVRARSWLRRPGARLRRSARRLVRSCDWLSGLRAQPGWPSARLAWSARDPTGLGRDLERPCAGRDALAPRLDEIRRSEREPARQHVEASLVWLRGLVNRHGARRRKQHRNS
jgi:hypothetical protein